MSTVIRRRRGIVVAATALVGVLGVIGWLIWPRSPAPTVWKTGTDRHLVTVSIDRLRLGDTAVDLTLTDRAGAPVDHAVVLLQAVQPLMGHAGAPIPLSAKGAGHFHAPALSLMMTGPWELRLSIDAHHGADQVTLPIWVGS